MSGRHAGLVDTSRRSFVLLSGATVLGLWFGLRAPDVTPVAPAGVVQPAEQVADTPVVVPDGPDGRGQRGGGR
jgi:hypothetical protein